MNPTPRTIRFTLLALGSAVVLSAAAPHPTVVLLSYKGQTLPLLRIDGTNPVVTVDGKERIVRSQPVYLMERADSYSGESAEITRAALGALHLKLPEDPSQEATFLPDPDSGGSFLNQFEVTLKPQHAIKGGYLVVGAYSPATFSKVDKQQRVEFTGSMKTVGSEQVDFTPAEVNLHALPDLPAGVETKVSYSTTPFSGGMKYYIQVFDGNGREMLTNLVKLSWPFYAMTEQHRLEGAIDAYQKKYPGADHPLVPVMMIKPLVAAGVSPPKEPITATLAISAKGQVDQVVLPAGGDAAFNRAIEEALGGWLFLPRLKGGQAVATQVKIPLSF